MSVVTRIAPSPTGPLHIGTARTALFNFLFARAKNGKFILRIEDTDTKRSNKKYEDEIINGLNWLGLTPDETYRQSERKDIYSKYIKKLLDDNSAYVSKENSDESGDSVIRLRNRGEKVSFNDIIRGDISFDTTELGDFVIARDKNRPLYHLAVVIDDHEMGITEVIRGEDHISNTPRQILIQNAIGVSRPKYAHIPLILAPDRSKLSKRDSDTISIEEFRKMGYLPDALVNYTALLGWNPGSNKETFTIDELVSQFKLTDVQKSGAIFNKQKLDWLNGKYLRNLPQDEACEIVKQNLPKALTDLPQYSEERVRMAATLILERIDVPSQIEGHANDGELSYLFDTPNYKSSNLNWKDNDSSKTKEYLSTVRDLIDDISEDFTANSVKNAIWEYASEKGRGAVLWPTRLALSGMQKSPDPFSIAHILGKKETLKRLDHAISQL